MIVVPVFLEEANAFVVSFHRHSKPVTGARFAIGAQDNTGELWGVAIVGRPVARMMQDGFTAEVTRCCVRPDGPRNVPSFLYGRCWRIWQAMGGRRMITYTLATESGASLRGAGWKLIGEVRPSKRPWEGPDRERQWQPVYGQLKFRWERTAEA